MIPDEARIRDVVRTVWSTQLGLDLDPDTGHPPRIGSPSLTAAIHVTGEFSGVVRLSAGLSVIRRVAAVMFSVKDGGSTADDERDAIGELANIVAGNIKALIPGESSISLPTIVGGRDYTVSTVDVGSSLEVGFSLDGEALAITIVEHTTSS